MIIHWFILVAADKVVATVRQQGTVHGTFTHHAAQCGISTDADAKRGRPLFPPEAFLTFCALDSLKLESGRFAKRP